MTRIRESVAQVMEFLKRQPDLDGSTLLKTEAAALEKAMQKYLQKAVEIELTLKPEYAETLALIEGDGKPLATKDFIKKFSSENCSVTLGPAKADKKARKELMLLAAKDNKLAKLKKALDPSRKYRELIKDLLELTEHEIAKRISSLKPAEFKGLVEANGLEVARTKSGTISTSASNKTKAVKQILHIKRSDQYLSGLRYAD
jgi:hypothetical protein